MPGIKSIPKTILKPYLVSLLLLPSLFLPFVIANTAVANEASPSILFVSGSHSNGQKTALLQAGAPDYGFTIAATSAADIKKLNDKQTAFHNHSLIIFDGVSSRDNAASFAEFLPLVKRSNQAFMAMKFEPEFLHNFSAETAKTIGAYYDNGGKKNIERLLSYFRYRVLDSNEQQAILPPVIYPQQGIYHPDYSGLIFETRQAYSDWLSKRGRGLSSDKPTVGILMQRASIEVMETSVIDATIDRIEANGAQAIPFFFELSPFAAKYGQLIQDQDQTIVDIIINFRMIHWANKRKTEFEKFGVPVMQALTYFDGGQQVWENDIQGISPGMTPFVLVLPETSGVINPLTLSAVKGGMSVRGEDSDEPAEIEVIGYQVDHMVSRTLAMVSLKYKANSDKKIAVMVWGSEDMGASFLNVPDSLHTLASRLNAEGYKIEPYQDNFYSDRAKAILEPFFRDDRLGEKMDELVTEGLADLLPLDEYFKWFNRLPNHVTQPIMDYWGHPKNSFMAMERNGEHFLLMPRIKNGNMVVLRQPPRADDKEQAERIYHDKTVPINHFYLAGYYYAREYWGSDAIVHLGTHGSQEYLYGKERVPSIYDHSNLAVWDTPILYPFIVDDVGEAMQSKRRGSATIISHMTPPFAAAGLQGELADIHNLMHEYKALDEGGVKEKTAQMIIDTCYEHNLCDDMGITREEIATDYGAFLTQLHDYMNELSGLSQPLGLHSYGAIARPELIVSTISQMLGSDFLAEAAEFESKTYKATIHDGNHQHGDHEKHNHDKGEQTHKHDDDSDHGFHETQSELEQLAGFKTVRDYVVGVVDLEPHGHKDRDGVEEKKSHKHSHNLPIALESLSDELQAWIKTGQDYYRNILGIKELDNTIAFLRGEYIPVTTGGDPLRHPDSLPTGYNLYGFDPARVPTKAAYEQGTELVEQIIMDYYNDNGRYPDKLAFSLWSIETMRQYGVLEAQALRAMGMRPVWSRDGRVIDSEIIPYSELKRPRVDIVLSSTGLYRDAFPNIMQYLAKAIEKISALDEDNNYVRINSLRIAKELKEQGVENEEADYLSSVRIFSNAPGQHGSGVDSTTFASDTWDDDSAISDIYLKKMGYYYGSDNSRYGKKLDNVNLYAQQLSGTDIALHARSSNLYGMLSTDDPFEYFGALSLAVRNIDGKSPSMVISNLRNPSRIKAETADKFLAKELRTRNFHPRWISEMMVEGYSGAVEMSARIDNFWGWQVVDPNIVRADQWQSFFEVYIEDSLELDIKEFFEEINPNAQARMLERMLEAVRKDYWAADEATLQAMIERYVEIVEQFDHYVDNEKLREFTNLSAQGFGLDLALPPPQNNFSANQMANPEAVEGQLLEQQNESAEGEIEWDKVLLISLLVIILLMIAGAFRQAREH